MDKTLINEVRRISHLMGVISEATVDGPFLKLIEEITKLAEKKVGKISRVFDDAVQDLKYVRTDEEAIKLLSKLTKESPEIAEKIIPKVMMTISDEERVVLKQLEDMVVKDIKEGGLNLEQGNNFIDNWLEENFKTEFSGVREIVKQDVKNSVRNSIDNAVNPKKITKTQQNLVSQIKNVGSTWYTTLEKAGLSKAEIISVSKAAPFRKLRADLQLFAENIFNNRIAGTKQVMEEMFGKLKTFTEQLQEGIVDLNYIRDINITLQSLKNSQKLDVNILREEIIKALKSAKGPNEERIPDKIIYKIENYLKDNNPTDLKYPSWISEWIPETSLGSLYKDLTKTGIDFESRFLKLMERQVSYMTTGTLKKTEEFRNYWIKYGVPKGLLKLYVDVSLITKVYVPLAFGTVISVIQAFYANFPGGEKMGYAQRFSKLLLDRMLDAIIPKDEDGSVNWVRAFVPFNFFWDNAYESIDEMSKGEFSWVYNLILSKEHEIESKLKEKTEEASKKVKVGVEKIENSETGFKVFIKTTWIDKENGESQLNGSETYTKNGDNYTITQDGEPYNYKWNGKTFEFIP